MTGWTATTLGKVVALQRGIDTTKATQFPGAVPVVSSSGISSYRSDAWAEGPGVIMGRKGTLGRVHYIEGPYWPHDTTLWVKDFKGNNEKFIYYFLKQLETGSMNVGSASPTLNRNHLYPLPVLVPPQEEQQAIAEVLGALDDKIALNTAIVAKILALGTAIRRQHVQGGIIAAVADVANFHNRKRIPLSAKQRGERRGAIPYWGANGQLDTVDEALFDEPLVLVGEDGTVMTSSGTAVAHHVWGPSWVNNHAHVLTGKGVSTEFLYFVMKDLEVVSAVTGAVQPKLSMGNLKRLQVRVPAPDRLPRLQEQLGSLLASYRSVSDESRILAELRDTLLPALMDGRLRVRDAIEQVEGVL